MARKRILSWLILNYRLRSLLLGLSIGLLFLFFVLTSNISFNWRPAKFSAKSIGGNFALHLPVTDKTKTATLRKATYSIGQNKKNNSRHRQVLNPHPNRSASSSEVQVVTADDSSRQPFRYILTETNLCDDNNTFILIYIHSAPDHFKLRTVIRETWGSTKSFHATAGIVTVFLIGNSTNEAIQSAVKLESQEYHDIVQENYIDSYRNLTYKAISGLRWVTHFCRSAKFVVKTDDDILVNTFLLVRYLRRVYLDTPNSINYICLYWTTMPILRDPNSKWYVSEKDFPGKFYPPYCSGSAYIMPTNIVPKLYNATFSTPFFWVDDVYITGLLAKAVGVSHTNIANMYVFTYENFKRLLIYKGVMFGHQDSLTIQQRYDYWEEMKKIEL